MAVVPIAKGLSLCDSYQRSSNGKIDLFGLFNAIRPEFGYPVALSHWWVFSQLNNGLGTLTFFIDVRDASRGHLIYTTEVRSLTFPDRDTLIQLAIKIEECQFPEPGVYVVELFCDNTWVCDTRLQLL